LGFSAAAAAAAADVITSLLGIMSHILTGSVVSSYVNQSMKRIKSTLKYFAVSELETIFYRQAGEMITGAAETSGTRACVSVLVVVKKTTEVRDTTCVVLL